MALVSFAAGVGSGWRVLTHQAPLLPPFKTTATVLLATFAGWYVWGFFTHLTDQVFFGGHSDYRGTLSAFGRVYVFQVLVFFTFTDPLGWLWGWIAFYVTIATWGIIGPRRLGMRAWQALVSATMGALLWLACLLISILTLAGGGTYLRLSALLV